MPYFSLSASETANVVKITLTRTRASVLCHHGNGINCIVRLQDNKKLLIPAKSKQGTEVVDPADNIQAVCLQTFVSRRIQVTSRDCKPPVESRVFLSFLPACLCTLCHAVQTSFVFFGFVAYLLWTEPVHSVLNFGLFLVTQSVRLLSGFDPRLPYPPVSLALPLLLNHSNSTSCPSLSPVGSHCFSLLCLHQL